MESDAGRLVCKRHGAVGRCAPDGVLEFDDDPTYWGEIDRERMRRVNRTARTDGWRTALARHLESAGPQILHYVQDPTRADWLVLLPLDRERTVSLDVGAGWGANSFGLAPHVKRHYAVEKIAERIEFIGIRAAQDDIRNLIPVRADLHALPLATSSLDVIAVNGVLEWAGLVDPHAGPGRAARNPRALQKDFLRALRSLLRPGGWLYVGIENRYGRMFLRGAPDHQGLRFTSLMPRRLARIYTRLRAVRSPRTWEHESDYRAWTYSLGGYRRLFADCGFTPPDCYAVLPGYNVPTRIVPLASRGPLCYAAGRERSMHRFPLRSWIRRATAATGLESRISSCYAFVTQRPQESA